MRFVISRRVRLVASIVTAGVVLAGCGSMPGQPGAAAVVGDTQIPLSQVQNWFDAVLEKEPQLKPKLQEQGQMDELGRQLASVSVQQELVEQVARKDHLTVSQQRVTADIDRAGGAQAATRGQLNTPENLRKATRTKLLAVEIGREYLDRTAITFDYTQANTRGEAERKAHRMAQGDGEAAAFLAQQRQAGVPVSLNEHMTAAQNAQLATATPLFGAAEGTVLAFEVKPQSGQWLIARIKERDTHAKSSNSASSQQDEQTLRLFGMRMLGAAASGEDVRLNPRYGVWDPIALAAAPNKDETLGFWLTGPSSNSPGSNPPASNS